MKVVKWKSRHTCTIWRGNRRLFSQFFFDIGTSKICKTESFAPEFTCFCTEVGQCQTCSFLFPTAHLPCLTPACTCVAFPFPISLIIDRNAFSPFSSPPPPPGCLHTWGKGREKPLETSSALATATRIDWSRHNFRTGEICAHRRFPRNPNVSQTERTRAHSRFPISQLQVRELNVSWLAGKLISKTASDDEPYCCRNRCFSSLQSFFCIAVHVWLPQKRASIYQTLPHASVLHILLRTCTHTHAPVCIALHGGGATRK